VDRSKYTPPKNPTKDKAMGLLAEVEKRRSEINLRWGEDRFKDLVDPDLRSRYRQMLDKFSAVKAGINYLAVNTMAEGMLRAYDKCEQNIRERGHKELNGEIWSFTWKEIRFLVVKDKAFFAKAVAMSKKENCIDSVWHIEELLKLIPDDSFIYTDVIKRTLPGSEVIDPVTNEEIDSVGPISPFLG
jgi:hypothetical protein